MRTKSSLPSGFIVPVLMSAVIGMLMVAPALQQVEHAPAKPSGGDAYYYAEALCGAFRWKGQDKVHSCEVDDFMSTITVTMELSSAGALQQCHLVSDTIADKSDVFRNRGWRLAFAYPGTGKHLATCGLK